MRPRGKLFALDVMRFADEVLKDDDIDVPESPKQATQKELMLILRSTGGYQLAAHAVFRFHAPTALAEVTTPAVIIYNAEPPIVLSFRDQLPPLGPLMALRAYGT